MVDSEHLTYIDCPYYTCRSAGDWSQSVCNLTGKLCDADEAGLECSMWEEEKADILREDELTLLDKGMLDNRQVINRGSFAKYILKEDVQPDISSGSS